MHLIDGDKYIQLAKNLAIELKSVFADIKKVKSDFSLSDIKTFDAIMNSETVANLKVEQEAKNKQTLYSAVKASRSINKESKGYLAKLLATENITIQHKKVKTAYFDVKNRILCLPIWKNMGNDVIDLLISHEVGHALFTPEDGWRKAIDKGIQHSFLNVIEDARIEKLIRRRYPGLKQSFINFIYDFKCGLWLSKSVERIDLFP